MPAVNRPRPDRRSDLVSAFALLLLSVGGWLFVLLLLGLRAWASSSNQARPAGAPAPAPPPYDWMPMLSIGGLVLWMLLVTGFAWYGGRRVTATVQGLLLAVVLLFTGAGYAAEHRTAPEPEPLPSNYQPCYSGSGRCN